jgi:hypothetical protein
MSNFKSIFLILSLVVSAFSTVTVKYRQATNYATTTQFTNLSKNFYMVSKTPFVLPNITFPEAYWGFFAVKNLSNPKIVDSLNIGGYYLYNGVIKQFLFSSPCGLQNDLDTIRSYYLKSGIYGELTQGYDNGSRYVFESHLRVFKFDSMYVMTAIPSVDNYTTAPFNVKVYKNYKNTWTLKDSIQIPYAMYGANFDINLNKYPEYFKNTLLYDFKIKNNTCYFLSSNDLYKFSGEKIEKIATSVLGYFIDNEGVWLTNSTTGELSFLKNGTRSIVKTGSIFNEYLFAVNPKDTTFFFNQSTADERSFAPYLDNSVIGTQEILNSALIYRSKILNNNLFVSSSRSYDFQTNYLTSTYFPLPAKESFFDESTQEITCMNDNSIVIRKFNLAPFFNNNNFIDSLGYLNEQTKRISYKDTLHAFDNSINDKLYFSVIQAPVGISITDSIFTLNTENIETGTHTIKFRVRDNFASPLSDTLTWSLKIFSRKISVNKSVTTTATEDIQYTQTISTTDNDNDSSFISYSKLPSWLTLTRTSKNQFSISGTPVNSTQDTTIKIIVTDNSNYNDPVQNSNVIPSYDTLTYNISVTKVNETPVITTTPSNSINFNNKYIYQVKASDEENDLLTYSLTQKPGTMSIDPSTGIISWTPTFANVGTHSITIKVADPSGAFATQTFNLTVVNTNQPPVITNSQPTSIPVAIDYEEKIYVTDENSFGLTFEKLQGPANLEISNTLEDRGLDNEGSALQVNVGLIVWNRKAVSDTGTHHIKYKVTDEYGLSTTKEYDLRVYYDGRKTATIYPLIPSSIATVNSQYTQNFNTSWTEEKYTGTYLTMYVVSKPSWLTFSRPTELTANLSGTPTITGDYQVKLTNNYDTLTYTITVNPVPNSTPVITSTAITTATEDVSYSYQVVATDVDNDPITYSLISNPIGMSISNGLITWSPKQSNTGSHLVTVKASDNKDASTTQTFTLNVNAVNDKPVITSTPITSAYKDMNYSYQVEAYDVDNDVLYYLINAPQGMTITSDGNISWTPNSSQIGNHNVTVQVSDGAEATSQTYSVTVNDVINNPIITSTPITSAYEDQQYEYQVIATDPNNDPLTYSLSGPAGMSISNTGKVTWTPTQVNIGSYFITIIVEDNNVGNAIQTYTLTVQNTNDLPIISSTPITTTSQNSVYTYQVQASDPDVGDALTYKVGSPSDMIIDNTGKITWTSDQNDIGTHTITVTVTDNSGASVQQIYTLNVDDINDAPVILTNFENISIKETDSLMLSAQVQDPDNNSTTTWFKNDTKIAEGQTCKILTDYTSAGQFIVKVVANDGLNEVQKSFTVAVSNLNRAPELVIVGDTLFTETDTINLTANVSDLDNDNLVTQWFKDTTLVATGTSLKIGTSFSSSGLSSYKAVVSDGISAVEKSVSLMVVDKNRAPIAQIKTDTILTFLGLNKPTTFNLKALDLDGDRLIYTIDTTGFDMTRLVVEIIDSNYVITAKKAFVDTLTFVISDGKTQIQVPIKVIVQVSTSINPISTRVFINSFQVAKGMIRYSVAKTNNVKLVIYTMNGRAIDIINMTVNPGSYSLPLTAKLATGNYIYKFNIGKEFSKTNKINIMR